MPISGTGEVPRHAKFQLDFAGLWHLASISKGGLNSAKRVPYHHTARLRWEHLLLRRLEASQSIEKSWRLRKVLRLIPVSYVCIPNCDQFNILLACIAVNKFYTPGNPLLYSRVLEILLVRDIVRGGTKYQRKEDDQEAKTYAARPGSRHSAPILFENFRNIQLPPIAPQSSQKACKSSSPSS